MEKKINLEEILNTYSSNGKVNDNPRAIITASEAKHAMLEFGKQLLEMAAENAEIVVSNYKGCYNTKEIAIDDYTDAIISKQSITNTLKMVI
jgi:hypothetical protein